MIEYTELDELLKNKRVILIGRSAYTVDNPEYENQGEFIDSFDIVSRINSFQPYKDGWRSDFIFDSFINEKLVPKLGKKTHILFLSEPNYRRLTKYRRVTNFKNLGGTCVIGTTNKTWKYSPELNDYINRVKHEITHINITYPFISSLKKEFLHFKKLHSVPSAGTTCISMLCNYNIKQLHLIGFTCFMLPTEQRYLDTILSSRIEWANPINDLRWLKQKMETDTRITTGPVLKTILSEPLPKLKIEGHTGIVQRENHR